MHKENLASLYKQGLSIPKISIILCKSRNTIRHHLKKLNILRARADAVRLARIKYLIRKAVNERVYQTGEHHPNVYHKLYDHLKINSYEALPATQFYEAIKFLGRVHIKSSKFTNDELCTLSLCYKTVERM